MKSNSNHVQTGVSVHHYTIPVKGIKKKVIYHFSDTHLAEYDALSDEQEIAKAIKETADWERARCSFAKRFYEPYEEAISYRTYEHFQNLLAVANEGDALVMTGDICDYISGANLRIMDSELGQLSVPFLYLCGNHEKPEEIPDDHIISGAKNPVQILDLEDIIIFGIDDSLRQITAQQMEHLKSILLLGKPIILAMHIPIMTEGNQAQLEACGEYFRLNHKDATEEVFAFIDLLKQNSHQIVAVLAGHLHFTNNSEVSPGVTQYVATQGTLGNINRYEIGI